MKTVFLVLSVSEIDGVSVSRPEAVFSSETWASEWIQAQGETQHGWQIEDFVVDDFIDDIGGV